MWSSGMKTAMNLQVPWMVRSFLPSWVTISFPRTLLYGVCLSGHVWQWWMNRLINKYITYQQNEDTLSFCITIALFLCFMIIQDLLNRTRSKQPLNWYKTLKSYYYRDEWELYDLKRDAEELNNVAFKPVYKVCLIWCPQQKILQKCYSFVFP